MAEDILEEDGRRFAPALLGDTAIAAGWRALLVLAMVYVLPAWVWRGAASVHALQWLGVLACYGLVSLAVFRFLESREAEEETVELLEELKYTPPAAANKPVPAASAETVAVAPAPVVQPVAQPETLQEEPPLVVQAEVLPQVQADIQPEVLPEGVPEVVPEVQPEALPDTSAVSEPAPQPPAAEWSVQLLHSLDWHRMGQLCAAFFADRFRPKPGKLAADGCMDIRLFREGETLPAVIVRCRAWGEPVIDPSALERLAAQMAQEFVEKGFFIGSQGFSAQARAFAKAHAIILIDDAMFITMLNRLPEGRGQQLLSAVMEGDYATPTCPVCNLKMQVQQDEHASHWACSAAPQCKGRLSMSTFQKTVSAVEEVQSDAGKVTN